MSSSYSTKNAAGVGRKRKRPFQSTAAAILDMPDIPGVPMDVIPLFVNAIKVATKMYAKCQSQVYHGGNGMGDEDDGGSANGTETSNALTSSSVILGALMDRMQAATETKSPEKLELELRQKRFQQASRQWLESVKRFAWTSRSPATTATAVDPTFPSALQAVAAVPDHKKPRFSVPYACFMYLWELQQTHDRIAVRRAALYLTGLLWQRSKDCRSHLEQENHLDHWMTDALLDDRSASQQQRRRPQRASASSSQLLQQQQQRQQHLLQAEADYWLTYLVEQGYSRLYPKIGVAAQRLRQQCPHLMESSAVTSATALAVAASADSVATMPVLSYMADWRRIRDIALEHGDTEIRHVERWMHRGHRCLEILVPRLGVEEEEKQAIAAKAKTTEDNTVASSVQNNGVIDDRGQARGSKEENEVEGDDDDNDEIDWEDGGDDDEGFEDGLGTVQAPNWEHFSAVERTLAAMESAGGLRGGELEIDLGKSKMEEEENTGHTEEQRDSAMSKFQTCISVLARKHMPRLTAWLEGLTHADNLQQTKSSLVSLPSEMSVKRRRLLHQLTDLKRSVSSLLTSASKLEIKAIYTEDLSNDGNTTASVRGETFLPLLQLSNSGNTANNNDDGRQNIMAAIHRHRKAKSQSRCNRIQIKFRTT